MNHTLQIQLHAREGAVLRTLGLAERRGFRLEQMHVAEAQGDGQNLRMTVSSDRSIELLKRQLERLHDVIWVEIESNGPGGSNWTQDAGMRPVTRSG